MADEQLGVAPAQFKGGITAVVPPDFSNSDRTIKRAQDFDNLTQRIQDLKGLDTPEKRLNIANDLRAVQPETSVWKGLAAALMGNKDAGRLMATEGRITSRIIYDVNGQPAMGKFAENNPKVPFQAVDINQNRIIPLDEYANRKFGEYDSYGATPSGMAKELEIKSRKPEYEKERAVVYTQSTAANNLKDLWTKQQDALQHLEKLGLSDKEQNLLSSYSNATAGYTQNLSDAVNTMKQAQKDQSSKDALTKSGKLKRALGIISGEAGISKEKVESMGSSELDQLYNTLSSGQNLEAKFSQDKKTAFEGAWARKLDPQNKKILEDAFNRAQNIAQLQTAASQYGDLNIAPTPFVPEIMKQAGSAALQSVIGQFKSEAAIKYAEWFDKQTFPEGQLPSPGQLQSAFMRTEDYANLKEKYGKKADEVEEKSRQAIKNIKQEEEPAKAQIGGIGVAPKESSEIKRESVTAKEKATPKQPSREDKVKSLVESLAKKLGGQ